MKHIRIFAIALTLVMLLSAAACDSGNNNRPAPSSSTPPPSSSSQEGTSAAQQTQNQLSNNDNSPCGVPGCPHDGYGVYEWTGRAGSTWRYEGDWKNCAPNGQGTVYSNSLEDGETGAPIPDTLAGFFVDGILNGAVAYTIFYSDRPDGSPATFYFDVDDKGIAFDETINESGKWGGTYHPFNTTRHGMVPWTSDVTPAAKPSHDDKAMPMVLPTDPIPRPDSSGGDTTQPTDPTPTPDTPNTSNTTGSVLVDYDFPGITRSLVPSDVVKKIVGTYQEDREFANGFQWIATGVTPDGFAALEAHYRANANLVEGHSGGGAASYQAKFDWGFVDLGYNPDGGLVVIGIWLT